jgi:type I restriction enzyme, S subunit
MTRVERLGDVAEINPSMPRSIREQKAACLVPFIGMASVSEQRVASYGESRPLGSVLKGFTYFQRDDVLLAKITPCFENGKAAHLSNLPAEIGFGSTEFHVLRAGPELDGRYLFHAVTGAGFRAAGERNMTGTAGQKRVPSEFVKRFRIPVPALDEQRRIARVLDNADAVCRKRRESLRLLDVFLRSVFLEMFGDPVRNEKGWPTAPLGHLAVIRRGASPRPIEQFMGGKVPWIKIGDATGSTHLYIERTATCVTEEGAAKSLRLDPGSIVVANSGVSLGFARILGIGGCIHDGWLSLESIDDRIEKIYLVSLINVLTMRLRSLAPKGTQPNLNTTILKSLVVPIPQADVQARFAAVIRRCDGLAGGLRVADQVTNTLLLGISAKAFGATT